MGEVPKVVTAHDDDSVMRSEAAHIAQSAAFKRSPVLRRLLDYLVSRTLSGEGDRLKAYQIAVDGLGRDESFDPQSDSYPRVQVGRLRKMLDLHYASHPPRAETGHRRLMIPLGKYSVQLVTVVARPAESASAAAEMPMIPVPAAPEPLLPIDPAPVVAPAVPPEYAVPARVDRPWIAWAAASLALLALAYAIWTYAVPADRPVRQAGYGLQRLMPHITINVDSGGSADPASLKATAQEVEMQLQRFDTLAVSFPERTGSNPDPMPSDYQLVIRPDRNARGTAVSLVLRHPVSGTTLWSRTITMADASDTAIGDAISQIARSSGVVAEHQLRLVGDSFATGYPCLAQYDVYRRRRDATMRAPLESCLKATLAAYPNEPLVLQALSFLTLSRPTMGKGASASPLAPSQEGRRFAEQALLYGRNSSLAQIAVARSALARGNCPRALVFARSAAEANPLDPDTVGLAGVFLLSCGDYAGAEPLLTRSMALESDTNGLQVASLISVLLLTDRPAEALTMANQAHSASIGTQPQFLLGKALALAANGRDDEARALWRELVAVVNIQRDASARAVLERFLLSDSLVNRMEAEVVRLGLTRS
ncbi:tetratricopeptide repeat protein [Blastomonas sp.]|uniref:tetratricopeptide repeat protein n=1 Tax=Blastomonas sp. TaxID=1909299 RepID=UPI003593BEE2